MAAATPKFGHAALVGRPNVGKSTLLNRLVGESVSIVTHKPQTTRHRVRGILTETRGQVVFVDTPGLHRRRDHALNRHLNRLAAESPAGVDLLLVVVDCRRQTDEDRGAMRMASQSGLPVILVLNKIDGLKRRESLLALTRDLSGVLNPVAVHYISALKGDGIEALLDSVFEVLPEGSPEHDPEYFTDHSERFLAAERVREQLMENLHEEIPYGTTVVIESFEHEARRIVIRALILVAEKRHKGIVIGRGGEVLKRIGSRARTAMKPLFGKPVHLELHVRDEPGWMDSEAGLGRLGYRR